jgi:hypothetical protein
MPIFAAAKLWNSPTGASNTTLALLRVNEDVRSGSKRRDAFTLTFSDGVQLGLDIHARRASGNQGTRAGTVTVTLGCSGECGRVAAS